VADRKQQQKRVEAKRRAAGIEGPHTVWIRTDLWLKLKERKMLTGQKLGHLLNKALYNFLIRDELEKRTGIKTEYEESIYDPSKGTMRTDEADKYIKE
jgi:hypothetical protein